MLVLGLLLILGSAALGVGFVFDGNEAAKVEMLNTTVNTTMAGVFFSGAGTMLLFLLGVLLLQSKMGRSRRKRAERKDARRQQRDSVKHLEQERTQLAAENERLSEQLDTRQGTSEVATDDAPTTASTGDAEAARGEIPASTGKHA
jgi:uncharacterized protein YlxW (UPF0749 family)